MADSRLDHGEGTSGLPRWLSQQLSNPSSSPNSPPNNTVNSTSGLPSPGQYTGVRNPFTPYQIARIQTNYDEQVMSPPIAPIPRSPAPSVSDSDCEIVAVVKKEETAGTSSRTNPPFARFQRGIKRTKDVNKMNVCELLQVRDGIDAKKQKLLEEYFQLDNQATELNQALQEKLGYRQ